MKNTVKEIIILGIESSCDETAVAITKGRQILGNVVASQHDIHSKFGGVVPELASRRHVEAIVPLLREALGESGITIGDIGGIAATKSPGLIGALLVGLTAAKALSFALGIPLIGVNHLEGHLNAVHLTDDNVDYPHIGLIVSGGHTSLYLVESFGKYKLLGATRDDAAGEAFDKVARLLGLGYPGGPIIEKVSKNGNPKAFKFKTPKFTNKRQFDFSFSGIKTAVMFEYKKLSANGKISESVVPDLAASFQDKVADILTRSCIDAAKKNKCMGIVISGGVAANGAFRKKIQDAGSEEKIKVHIPPMGLCTDNAAMIAYVGGRRLAMNETSDLNINAVAVEEIGK